MDDLLNITHENFHHLIRTFQLRLQRQALADDGGRVCLLGDLPDLAGVRVGKIEEFFEKPCNSSDALLKGLVTTFPAAASVSSYPGLPSPVSLTCGHSSCVAIERETFTTSY